MENGDRSEPLRNPAEPHVDGDSENYRKQFAANLRRILDGLGYLPSSIGAATALAETLQHRVSTSAVQKWLSGERIPDIPTLVQLAIHLRVSVDYLLRGEEALLSAQTEGLPCTAAERTARLQLIDQLVVLPQDALRTGERNFVGFSRGWLAEHFPGVLEQDLDIMVAQGDHMAPSIRNGDPVIYWNAPRFFEDNCIFILQVGHNRLLRRIRQLAATGEYEISCDNPRFPAERVPAETFPHPLGMATGTPRIIGKVLGRIAVGSL